MSVYGNKSHIYFQVTNIHQENVTCLLQCKLKMSGVNKSKPTNDQFLIVCLERKQSVHKTSDLRTHCLCYINERVLDSKYWSLKGHSPMQAGKGWCCKCSTPVHNSIWRVTVGVNFVAHSMQFSYSNSRTTQQKQEGTNIEKQVITT